METGRIIKITGQSSMKVKPDTAELTIELNGSAKKYDDAIRKYRKETAAVKQPFAKIGFGKDDFETKKFNIETRYKSFPIRKGLYFAGYHFTQTMKLCFPVDGERIGAVLKTLKSLRMSERILKFDIIYSVKDAAAAENQLLQKAVQDAEKRAQILAEASGVKLGEIVREDYQYAERDLSTNGSVRFLPSPRRSLGSRDFQYDAVEEDDEIPEPVRRDLDPNLEDFWDDLDEGDSVSADNAEGNQDDYMPVDVNITPPLLKISD